MKEVRKKSIDAAVNQVLKAAYRQQVPLVWDRAEPMQPQCGFGRLALCCTSCQEGPCRINPFGEADQETICGRTGHDLVTDSCLKKASDGALALAKLAVESGNDAGGELIRQVLTADDEMIFSESADDRLQAIGLAANAALEALRQSQDDSAGAWQSAVTEVNLGVLKADSINIIFHGHVSPNKLAGVKAAAEGINSPVNLVAMCGNEFSAGFLLPVLTNYASQETPLLTGAVDLLVIGNQCVMPSLINLADRRGIAIVRAALLREASDFQAAILQAQHSFQRRAGRTAAIPPVKSPVYAGYTLANSRTLFQTLADAYTAGKVRGIIYLGGCGSIKNTQDAKPVQLAAELISAGYFVITSGCAGTALAKAGLCHPGWNNGDYPLNNILPPEIPPVLNIGSCHDAGEMLRIAEVLRQKSTPVFAVFPEVAHNKTLAVAVGFTAAGINTWLGFESFFAGNAHAEWLVGKLGAKAGARLLPWTDSAGFLQSLAEMSCGLQQGR